MRDFVDNIILGALVAAAIFFTVVGLVSFTNHDDTDPRVGHSGLNLYTDYGTGCQYVGKGDSITPRMGDNGKQVCK